MIILNKEPLACINCGNKVDSLYKQYSSTVLKLTQCSACGKVADKYIEYDNVIIFIDIVLFSKEAYRHLLLNTCFKNHWKLAILILLMKTYDEWTVNYTSGQSYRHFAPEQAFYLSFLVTLAGAGLYVSVLSAIFVIRIRQSLDIRLLWKTIVISNFGQFLLLPSIIWVDSQRHLHLALVLLYTTLSQIQALSSVISASKTSIVATLLAGNCVQHFASQYSRTVLL